ncbi:MAG: PilW family protein [Myxococcaceae bacterium]
MKRAASRSNRGITLIELVVAMAVMLVAVAAATTLMVAAVRMARDRTGNVEAAERSRLASAEMLENLERAGLGASTSITVNIGTPTQINPIYVVDNSAGLNPGGNGPNPVVGTDEIWMVSPARLALGEACWDTGAKTPIVNMGTPIQVACGAGFSSYQGLGRFLMMISSQGTGKAALLSNPTVTGNNVTSADIGAAAGVINSGDSMVGVQVLHYYIGLNPNDKDPDGTMHPALFRAYGSLSGGTAAAPFSNSATPGVVPEIPDVEDLQIVTLIDPTGAKNPNLYDPDAGLPPTPLVASPKQVKAMRVTLVARAHNRSLTGDGNQVNQLFAPLTVENHSPVATPDGYQRVTFGRRVELPNMAMTAF